MDITLLTSMNAIQELPENVNTIRLSMRIQSDLWAFSMLPVQLHIITLPGDILMHVCVFCGCV